jgi:hypothetical protein
LADGQGQADLYEALIDQRLRKTRRQVKGVEISAALIGMIAATLGYLLLAAVADQWLIPGGLGFWGRSLLFIVLAAGLGYYFLWQRLLPLLLHRINPIFAAQVIERSRPSLKNSLINFLFLRRDRDEAVRDDLQRRVYFGLQRTAAAEVAQVEVEAAVDHAQVIRLGYVLAGVLLVACLYLLFSPKNPLVSFSRVILPWADIGPPTRVTISEIEPGNTVAYQGDQLAVSAEVHGLRADEPVTLYYTTADHQSVDQAVAMTLPDGRYRHSGKLPPGDLELQQDLSYYLVAGDCKTRPYQVRVETALSIDVARVDYRYPAYTGLAPKTVRGSGDLRAIDGTRATLHATVNQEIQQASVELGNDHRTWLKMKAQGKSAVVDLQLLLKPDDPTQPQYDSYQVRCTDALNHENPRPVRHPIEVFRDAPPTITLVDPPADQLQLPAGSTLSVHVLAEDPDFGLRRVAVQVRRGQEPPKTAALLNLDWKKEKPLLGPFKKSCPIMPASASLGFKPGDKLTYWAEADDCRETEDSAGVRAWKPNHVETERRTILVVADSGPRRNQSGHSKDQSAGKPQRSDAAGQSESSNSNAQEQPDASNKNAASQPQESETPPGQPSADHPNSQRGSADPQPKADPGDAQKPPDKSEDHGDQRDSSQQPPAENAGKQDGSPQEKVNGESDPATAMQDILHQKEQEKQQPSQNDNQQTPSQQQQKDQQSGQQQSGQQQSGQQQSGQQQSGQQQSGQQQSGQQQSGQQQSGQQQSGQQQSGQQQSGQQQSGQQQSGQQQSGQQQSGQPQSGQQQSGQPQSGQPQPGQQPQAGDGQSQQGQKPQAGQAAKSDHQSPAGDNTQPRGQPQPGVQPQSGDQSPPGGQGTQGGKNAEGQQAAGAKPETAGTQPSPSKSASSSGTKGGSQKLPDNQPPTSRDTPPGEKSGVGEGSEADDAGPKQSPQQAKTNAAAGQQPKPHGGETSQTENQPGKGNSAGKEAGGTSPQETNLAHGKKPGSPEENKSKSGQDSPESSPSVSPKQSDSHGDQQGDRSGGGGKGGGQQANQAGTDTAGSNTSAEQGAGQSNDQGEGEIGKQGGDKVRSDHATGHPASQGEGPGSTSRQKAGGEKPGERTPRQQQQPPTNQPSASGGKGSSQPSGSGNASDPKPSTAGTSSSGNPVAGGSGSDEARRPPPPPQQPNGTLSGDAANLDFARKQTDLALDYLARQLAKEKPDPRLLDRLGWTRADLEKFYRQWAQMRRDAQTAGPEAKRQYNEALRSLGLRPRSTELRGGGTATDKSQHLRDSRHSNPPPGWGDLFNAYSEGIAGKK